MMKKFYKAPDIELMNLSKDVITTSAADPYAQDIKWDLTATAYDPASILNID